MAHLLGEGKQQEKYTSIAWTPMVTFCTCVPSEATLEETRLIYHCRTLEIPSNWIEYICHVGSSHYCMSIIQSGMIAGGKDSK